MLYVKLIMSGLLGLALGMLLIEAGVDRQYIIAIACLVASIAIVWQFPTTLTPTP